MARGAGVQEIPRQNVQVFFLNIVARGLGHAFLKFNCWVVCLVFFISLFVTESTS
jgi:hypothetical protein